MNDIISKYERKKSKWSVRKRRLNEKKTGKEEKGYRYYNEENN